MSSEKKHWLYRAENQRTLWIISAVILVLAVLPEFFIHHYAHFEQQGIHVDTSFGFYAWYSFLACVAMIVGAKLLGIFLKRKDTYYDE